MATDPTCGMKVEQKVENPHLMVGAETYYFCSEGCKQEVAGKKSHLPQNKWRSLKK